MPSSLTKLDHLPAIAEDLSRHATDLKLLGDYVLIETNPREGMVGSLHVPTSALEVYPTSGWVYDLGPKVCEELRVGDFVLVEEEGLALDYTYYDMFEITLKHDSGFVETIFVEIEAEPVVKERVSTYRRGGDDMILSVVDKKNGGSISFNCSNVLDWQMGQLANSQQNLTYVPVHMYVFLNEDEVPALFYITQEARIILTVEYDFARPDGSLQSDRDHQAAAYGTN